MFRPFPRRGVDHDEGAVVTKAACPFFKRTDVRYKPRGEDPLALIREAAKIQTNLYGPYDGMHKPLPGLWVTTRRTGAMPLFIMPSSFAA